MTYILKEVLCFVHKKETIYLGTKYRDNVEVPIN
jgi:hypothetical protein